MKTTYTYWDGNGWKKVGTLKKAAISCFAIKQTPGPLIRTIVQFPKTVPMVFSLISIQQNTNKMEIVTESKDVLFYLELSELI